MSCCRKLYEYVHCIETIRDCCADVDPRDEDNVSKCIEHAIDVCIEKGYLADILKEERSEVFDMFLDGCSVEEYVGLQVRDKVAQTTEQVTKQVTEQVTQKVTQQSLNALVSSLKTFIPDINTVTETIRQYEGFENITLDMVKKYW